MLESYLAIPPLLGVLGLLVALGIYIVVTRFSEGDDNVKKIGCLLYTSDAADE